MSHANDNPPPAAAPAAETSLLWRLLGVDLRSLAALRIGLGLVLLADIVLRAMYTTAHYTDAGTMSRSLRMALSPVEQWVAPPYYVSPQMLSGAAWFQFALFGLAALCALALVIGYQTRIASIGSWILLIGVHARNPMVLQGGDDLLRCLLFWCMFLPLGAVWSADRWLRPVRVPRRVVSIAGAGLLLQLCCMYWFTAVLKWDPAWRTDFSAVYYALSYDHFTTTFGYLLLQYPNLLAGLTLGTIVLEFAGPFLLFVPLRNDRWRTIAAASFIALHLGLAATLELGLFPYICIVYWLAVLPGCVWDSFSVRPVARSLIVLHRIVRSLRPALRRLPTARPYYQTGLIANGFLAACLAFVLLQNAARTEGRFEANLAPGPLRWIGEAAQLNQYWCMFSPAPPRIGGWLVAEGTLLDGTRVNLLDEGQASVDGKPELVSAVYPSQRWRKCLMNVFERDSARHRQGVSDYLVRRWNGAHRSAQRIARLDLIVMVEPTRPPGAPRETAETIEPVTVFSCDYRGGLPGHVLVSGY